MPEAGGAGGERTGSLGDRLRRWVRSRRVIVHDESMLPTLWPGDRLLVDRSAFAERAPRPGEIVVVRDPEVQDRLLVKRVERVRSDPGSAPAVFVVGDNAERSRDSRAFGPLAPAALVGRAYRCYAPAERRRDL